MDLSVCIPARNEMFLNQTIDSLLRNMRADTEIVVTLDGQWPVEPVPDHERVTLIYHPEAVGQRAATNDAAKIARGKYVMKLDAHCDVAEGFDAEMLAAFAEAGDDVTMVPIMKNLHVFDWVCRDCGERRYQGHSGPCQKCGGETERDIVWRAKPSPNSRSYCFDSEPHFQYFGEFSKRPEGKGDLTETMSLQGSCWMLTREKYFALDVCDEAWGFWGSQGIEVACKTWLSGGRCLVNQRTWYAHAFRTKGGDWGFPYPLSGKQTRHAKEMARDTFFTDSWPQQVRPLSWLVERFWPVKGWTDEDLARIKDKGAEWPSLTEVSAEPVEAPSDEEQKAVVSITSVPKAGVYYTDNRLDPTIMRACQNQLLKAGIPVVSVSLAPLDFGRNFVVDGERGPLTMFRQILAGLEAIDSEVAFLLEHDIIYSKSHFAFSPERVNLFYYNNNLWKVDAETGKALFHYSNHTSQLCAARSLLLEHYRKRVAMVEANGFSNRVGYEPGTNKRKERIDDYWHETWMSEMPNLDIRHGKNLTRTRWDKSEFRNQRYTEGWTIADHVDGWYEPGGLRALLEGLADG